MKRRCRRGSEVRTAPEPRLGDIGFACARRNAKPLQDQRTTFVRDGRTRKSFSAGGRRDSFFGNRNANPKWGVAIGEGGRGWSAGKFVYIFIKNIESDMANNKFATLAALAARSALVPSGVSLAPFARFALLR